MLASVSMSRNYIERALVEAAGARPDEVLGCPVRYGLAGASNDIFIHMDSDNSPLLDTLLEMADKGDLTEDWFLHVDAGRGLAWFTYDRDYPFAGVKWMIGFTPFPELEASLPESENPWRSLRFAPGVKLHPAGAKEEDEVQF